MESWHELSGDSHGGVLAQSAVSSQSVRPSQSLSNPSLHDDSWEVQGRSFHL